MIFLDPLDDVDAQLGRPRLGAGELPGCFDVTGLDGPEVAEGADRSARVGLMAVRDGQGFPCSRCRVGSAGARMKHAMGWGPVVAVAAAGWLVIVAISELLALVAYHWISPEAVVLVSSGLLVLGSIPVGNAIREEARGRKAAGRAWWLLMASCVLLLTGRVLMAQEQSLHDRGRQVDAVVIRLWDASDEASSPLVDVRTSDGQDLTGIARHTPLHVGSQVTLTVDPKGVAAPRIDGASRPYNLITWIPLALTAGAALFSAHTARGLLEGRRRRRDPSG
ncbi:hypothetical protein [Streptomyces sp. NPDC048606]|uniref:hypothetical protein n=1 Tax=Streptomyces sp. NPDC048606 TaxID=3154726 RepID=UPI00343539A1